MSHPLLRVLYRPIDNPVINSSRLSITCSGVALKKTQTTCCRASNVKQYYLYLLVHSRILLPRYNYCHSNSDYLCLTCAPRSVLSTYFSSAESDSVLQVSSHLHGFPPKVDKSWFFFLFKRSSYGSYSSCQHHLSHIRQRCAHQIRPITNPSSSSSSSTATVCLRVKFFVTCSSPIKSKRCGRVQADRWEVPSNFAFAQIFHSHRPAGETEQETRDAERQTRSWHPDRWIDSAPSPTLLKGRWTSKKKMGAEDEEDEDARLSKARKIQQKQGVLIINSYIWRCWREQRG